MTVLPQVERHIAKIGMEVDEERFSPVALRQQPSQVNSQAGHARAALGPHQRQNVAVHSLVGFFLSPAGPSQGFQQLIPAYRLDQEFRAARSHGLENQIRL